MHCAVTLRGGTVTIRTPIRSERVNAQCVTHGPDGPAASRGAPRPSGGAYSWRSHLAQDGGRGRFRFTGAAESAQVVDDMVSVSRGSTRGENSVRPDEREAAAEISADDIDELGVAPDAD